MRRPPREEALMASVVAADSPKKQPSWLPRSRAFAKTNRHFDEQTTMTAEETVAFSLWDVYQRASPAFFLYDHYLVGTSWFPRKAINCPREVEKVLRWKGWTVFNLPVDSQWAPPKYEQLGRIFPILKSHSVKAPPPPCIFIYMARVAVQRISIFRLRVSFQAYIPNAVDHQRYAPPPSPLLAFMYTNTHLLGARPSGRELQRANLWSPGEGKGQGTQTGLTSLPPFTASETLGPRYGKRCFSFSNCIGLFNSFPEQTSQRGYLFS